MLVKALPVMMPCCNSSQTMMYVSIDKGNHLHLQLQCGQSREGALQQPWLCLQSSFHLNDLHYVTQPELHPQSFHNFLVCRQPRPRHGTGAVCPFKFGTGGGSGGQPNQEPLAKPGSSDVHDPPPATACPPCLAQHPAHKTATPPFPSFILFRTDLIPQSWHLKPTPKKLSSTPPNVDQASRQTLP